jgi:hypothetical protein
MIWKLAIAGGEFLLLVFHGLFPFDFSCRAADILSLPFSDVRAESFV